MLCIIDEFTRESLAIRVARKLKATDVIKALWGGSSRGAFLPTYVQTMALSLSPRHSGIGLPLLEPRPPTSNRGAPWENGYCESFNGKRRDELLNGEIFYTLKEAQIGIENWRRHYNTVRPRSSLGYRPPAPEALVWPAPKEIVKI